VALPDHLLKKTPKSRNIRNIRSILNDSSIHTVCEEASCPNIGECFSQKTCTFMILGNICTRCCSFCNVRYGQPLPLDPGEPEKIAEASKKLGLKYIVVTSVTRDDLPDGGANHFAAVIKTLRLEIGDPKVEVLIPDFQGKGDALAAVIEAGPYVLNHNIETVPRLYPRIRPQADYERSLMLLRSAKAARPQGVYTKSGFMVGLGETDAEVISTLEDLRSSDCDIVTIGQYLPPSRSHPKPERLLPPDSFAQWQAIGQEMGFQRVEAGPFVRSSYHAGAIAGD
jgi:lipoic acid synthetase